MRNQALLGVFLLGWLPNSEAKADFRISSAGGVSHIAAQAGPSMPLATSDASDASDASGDTDELPVERPKVRLAVGFGQSVPLSFATRQIVPRNIHIRFGPGVNQAVLVDWTGGRPWNQVMASAVKPLGLHLAFTRTSVLIF